MKKYKINALNQVFNTISDGNVNSMLEKFWEKSDGKLIIFYNHISGNGNRMFIFKNSIALLINGTIYKYTWDELKIEIEEQNLLKSFFSGSHFIYLKDKNSDVYTKDFVKFNVGRVMIVNGVQGASFDKQSTIAFKPFIENLQQVIPKLSDEFKYYFVLTASINEKGSYKFKPYSSVACQELLFKDNAKFYIVNESIYEFTKEEIQSIEISEKKGLFGNTKLIHLLLKNNAEYFLAGYQDGNPNNAKTEELLTVF